MAAVGFAGFAMPSYDRALWAMRSWLDSWSGIGRVARSGCIARATTCSPHEMTKQKVEQQGGYGGELHGRRLF
jgi:hypothetical protein